ncbi:MAG TPA: hypothetical protein VLW25_04140 [Bryobacteraceae bacterium]|nr:hypothetical protein [Bryobacteraceae bacterium]
MRAALCITVIAVFCGILAGQSEPQSSSRSHHSASRTAEAPSIEDGIYRNPSFHFSYKIPFGWVVRTEAMQPDAANTEDASSGQVLLAVFEHPPEVSGSTINASVVIATESLAAYQGSKTAIDYLGVVNNLVTAQGFTAARDPQDLTLDGKSLVRGDFSKPRGSLTMHQSTLVMLQKGRFLSFTFVAGSDDDVDELIGGLSFATSRKPASSSPPKAPN